MKIIIITPGFKHQNSIALLTPLEIWKKQINDIGLNFKISNKISDHLDGDIVIVDSKFHRNDWIENKDKIFNDFINLRKKFKKIVYCDTADSSGWIQSEVFKFVDKYWKLQILKDKKKYLKKMYDRRIYTDFYYKKYSIKDNEVDFSEENLRNDDLKKIEVFWNSSMADYSTLSHYYKKIYKYLKLNYLISFKYQNPYSNILKSNDVFAKFNSENYRETIKFHRKSILKKIEKYYTISNKKINRIKFLTQLSKSKITLSPFGWGEIAYRDYETFLNKSILLKPNMDHINTWPDLYKDNQTYVSFDWQLDELNDKIEYILSNYKYLNNIAANGFDNYRKFTYGAQAEQIFIERLNHLIKKI